MAPVKDVQLLGQVIRRAAEEKSLARFLVVGEGEQRAELEAQIKDCNNVMLLGWRRDMERVWSAADAAILTSRNEGTPTALIEAMAVGLPFVSTNVGAVADLAVGSLHELPSGMGVRAANGFLAERTADALYYGIWQLISNPEVAKQMGAEGRNFVMARFCSSRLIEELKALYLAPLLEKKGYPTMTKFPIIPEQNPSTLAVAAVSQHGRGTMKRTILITGGAGFIGSNFVLEWAKHVSCAIVILDKLTYAGNLQNLHLMFGRAGYHFVHGDICDRELVRDVLQNHRPSAVVHFAAESHVDRWILGPKSLSVLMSMVLSVSSTKLGTTAADSSGKSVKSFVFCMSPQMKCTGH